MKTQSASDLTMNAQAYRHNAQRYEVFRMANKKVPSSTNVTRNKKDSGTYCFVSGT